MTHPAQAIVVTGAAGGIGSRIVLTLLRRGSAHGSARIIALDRPEAPSHVSEELGDAERAGLLERRVLDVTNAEDVDWTLREIAEGATLRAVVHVAGVLHAGPALATSAVETRRLFDVNALGTIAVLTAAAREMCSQDVRGLGVNVRSLTTVASNAGTGPRAHFAAYGASKAAASSFTRSLGLEVGSVGIRCNVIAPGTTRTPMVHDLWRGADLSTEIVAGDPALYRGGVPLGRVADPDDVADVVDFLVSERARHITLAELTVDGGATQR